MLPHRINNEKNHIKCTSITTNTRELELMINTGSDINIIKIDYLSDLIVDETKRILIRGISQELIRRPQKYYQSQ